MTTFGTIRAATQLRPHARDHGHGQARMCMCMRACMCACMCVWQCACECVSVGGERWRMRGVHERVRVHGYVPQLRPPLSVE